MLTELIIISLFITGQMQVAQGRRKQSSSDLKRTSIEDKRL